MIEASYRKPFGRFVFEFNGGTDSERGHLITAAVHAVANASANAGPKISRIAAEQFYRMADDLTVNGGALSVDSAFKPTATLRAIEYAEQNPPETPWWKGWTGGWAVGCVLGLALNFAVAVWAGSGS